VGDALADGGGIHQAGDGTVVLANTLIAGNTDNSAGEQSTVHPDCSGTFESLGHNLIGDSPGGACANVVNGVKGDLVGDRTVSTTIDPKLGPLQDNGGGTLTHALQPNSPAIDAGSPGASSGEDACAATDQRGIVRPQGIRCDIGAYERLVQVDNPFPSIASISPTTVTAGDPSFTLTITGTGFVPGSAIYWNAGARPTQFISDTQLTAVISPADIGAAGTASVTVFNPTPGGGMSTSATLIILKQDEAPGDAVVFLPLILK